MRPALIITVASVAAVLTAAGPAWAASGANRTFVSGLGSDANPCSLAAPCRSFAQAILLTNPGGDIVVLDSAGYGQVTITKSVSILNEEGVVAGITATSGDGITVSTAAGDVVNLRGLTLVGAGGNNGISLTSGTVLNVQNCVIRGFAGDGMFLTPTKPANINIANTIVSGNGSDGVHVEPSGPGGFAVTASFEQVQAIHNGVNGFAAFGSSFTAGGALNVTAADSLASGNGGAGYLSSTILGEPAPQFTVTNSKSTNNGSGVTSSRGAIYLNGVTIAGSTNAGVLIVNSGTVFTYGNNALVDVVSSGILTSLPLQ